LLALSGVVATVADAQPARRHARIGLLANLPNPQVDAFRDGLKDFG
jgi:hypothetical protein